MVADVPVNKNTLLSLINFGKDDEPTLAVDKVRYKGEPIVAIIAESEHQALAARNLVRIDYEPLPAVFDVEEALKPGAPVVNDTYPKNYFEYHEKYDHQKLRFATSRGASPQPTSSSRIATDVSDRACAYGDERLHRRAGAERPLRRAFLRAGPLLLAGHVGKDLNLDSNRLHFIGGTVGGGFGGKVDSLSEPLSILGAMMTGRPVRYVLDREEEMLYGSPRGAERIYIKDGIMRDGRIVARHIRSYFDAGAYTRLSSYAAIKCTAHVPGPYTIPNVASDIHVAYTNRCPSTAMRGFRHHGCRLRA